MGRKKDADPIASAMVAKRYAKMTAKERSEAAKNAAASRWAGHQAKRPAASRKPKKKAGGK